MPSATFMCSATALTSMEGAGEILNMTMPVQTPSSDVPTISVVQEAGKGRTIVVLFEKGEYHSFAERLFGSLTAKARVLLVAVPQISPVNWREAAAELRRKLEEFKIRQLSFVAFGGAGALAQAVAIEELRLVRTLVFIDAATRPHPTRRDRILDRLERFFPLGLPMRSQTRGFDGKPYLQRMRCPVLIVSSERRTPFLEWQARMMAEGMPTAWLVKLEKGEEGEELAKLVAEFQEVPAKCPQG